MSSTQFLKNGDLENALKKLQGEVRDNPAEPKHRVFLFQLLSILGQWEKALTQLNVVRDLSPEALPMVQTYQETLNCEALRLSVFNKMRSPLLFGEPEPWMAMMLEALRLEGQGNGAEGAELRGQALEGAPTTSGKLWLHPPKADGDSVKPSQESSEFEWIADADSRIGPFLEAVIHGKYFWVPFQRIRWFTLEKTVDLRDLVWLPARFEWANGGNAVGFVPTRYCGSESSQEDALKLGRKTIWTETFPSTFVGTGQRILATDVDEYPLTSLAKIEFGVE